MLLRYSYYLWLQIILLDQEYLLKTSFKRVFSQSCCEINYCLYQIGPFTETKLPTLAALVWYRCHVAAHPVDYWLQSGILFNLVAMIQTFPWSKMETMIKTHFSVPWASYQIRKIAGCACTGNVGNVLSSHWLQRKTIVSYPSMHHGTYVIGDRYLTRSPWVSCQIVATHMPWCMPSGPFY